MSAEPIIPDVIERAWQSFDDAVVPHDAPDTQRIEMRRAFFAGASSLFGAIMTIMDPDDEPTERDEAQMSAINDELTAFGAAIGRAAETQAATSRGPYPDDAPIRTEVRATMNNIGELIGQAINPDGVLGAKQHGFALLVFDYGPSGFMNYISNAERRDMIKAMKEFIARNEKPRHG